MAAKKKNRSSSNDRATTTASAPAVNTVEKPFVTTDPAIVAKVEAKPKPAQVTRSFWERAVIRVAKLVGSLQIAVIVLVVLVVVLTIGTMVESWYTGKLAQELIYRTWWFNALMGVLFLNIFFAAAKKWPWKKHQTGFVITHIGLELMIIGGVVNSLYGVDSIMQLVSQETEQAVNEDLKQSASSAIEIDESLIEVTWPAKYKQNTRRYPFSPGTLSWGSSKEDNFKLKLDSMLHVLSWMAHPFPHGWSANLDHGAELEILNYYSHAKLDWFKAAPDGAKDTCIAARIELNNPRVNTKMDFWLATDDPRRSYRLIGNVAMADLLTTHSLSPQQLKEFTSPPRDADRGEMGELVVFFDGKPYRFRIDKFLKQAPLPFTDGWAGQVVEYYPEGDPKAPFDPAKKQPATNPWVQLELLPPGGAKAIPVMMGTRGQAGVALGLPEQLSNRVQVWYHVPDWRYGLGDRIRGVLQLAPGEGGVMHYRTFNTNAEQKEFMVESTGPAPKDKEVTIWGKMQWGLRIPEYLPKAAYYLQPENKRPGLDHRELAQALHCRLTIDKESKEFWLAKPKPGMPDRSRAVVEVGGEKLMFHFGDQTIDLPFEVKLLRAEETTDPGSSQAASYSSFVMVKDKPSKDRNGPPPSEAEYYITMNEPMKYDGYKFFQTGMNTKSLDPDPETLRPVAISTFTVSSDPGLMLKYLGSIFLAMGIVMMFYTKKYVNWVLNKINPGGATARA